MSLSRLESILDALNLKLGDVFDQTELDEQSNQFVQAFYLMDSEKKKQYAKVFMEIIDLNS
ncbi:hypothetical protein FC97_GL001265 [Companilactobacillus kimchii DSM 13961 = JCM 10707]|uniref:HTH cro/C1-type domain-containing protein n=1 Tax=Companilactobacillus kimchii DSM 13961 = JCM 10707 TaxID=1423765 RepID=A0ABR5NSB8_9LACO|nr:hypothetical protein FC97_GL001265 [Companilactobacillus kimchii DSM 13961 = JCM 10707]